MHSDLAMVALAGWVELEGKFSLVNGVEIHKLQLKGFSLSSCWNSHCCIDLKLNRRRLRNGLSLLGLGSSVDHNRIRLNRWSNWNLWLLNCLLRLCLSLHQRLSNAYWLRKGRLRLLGLDRLIDWLHRAVLPSLLNL